MRAPNSAIVGIGVKSSPGPKRWETGWRILSMNPSKPTKLDFDATRPRLDSISRSVVALKFIVFVKNQENPLAFETSTPIGFQIPIDSYSELKNTTARSEEHTSELQSR